MQRQVYLLDLSDLALAEEYDAWHQPGNVPVEVLVDIKAAGNVVMEIYRSGDRLVMITESAGTLPPGDRVRSQASQAWEARMDRYQKPLAGADAGAKWQPARRIFDLQQHSRN